MVPSAPVTYVRLAKVLYSEIDTQRLLAVEPSSKYRSEFKRDYGRLVHSAAFRRLQGKTQLFPGQESDFFRNRLTHSIEVAQIAKSIACRVNQKLVKDKGFSSDQLIDIDLVEFSALSHDLGHPPFGHVGEGILDEIMRPYGGF
ncbi:MAG: dGTP triphosphohydrolase, partial [Bacteroidota bacterium]